MYIIDKNLLKEKFLMESVPLLEKAFETFFTEPTTHSVTETFKFNDVVEFQLELKKYLKND